MPNFYLISMEIIVVVLLIVCLRHAWRAGPEHVLRLAAGVLFGVLLELATIYQLSAYSYGAFLLMIMMEIQDQWHPLLKLGQMKFSSVQILF